MSKCKNAVVGVIVLVAACAAVDLRSGPGDATLTAPAVSVPVDWSAGWPVVEVFLGAAGPYRFLLDTGSGHVLLSSECAKAIGLATSGRLGTRGGQVGSVTAVIESARVPEVRVGAATFRGVPCVVDDLSRFGVDGILGFLMFRDLLLTIDGPGRTLVLERGVLPAPDSSPECLPLDLDDGVPHVWGRIGGRRARILVDSGFQGTLYLASGTIHVEGLEFVRDPKVRATSRSRTGEHSVEVGALRESVEVGPWSTDEVPTVTGMGASILLGAEFLASRRVTFDQLGARARIVGSP